MTHRTCSVDGCHSTVLARGFCRKHYARFRKYGTTNLPPKPVKPPKPEPRQKGEDMLRQLIAIETDECVEWPRGRYPTGYGHIGNRGPGGGYTHREAMFLAGIAPAEGQTVVRHLCHNPPCVNLRHLRWGTVQDNIDDRTDRGVWHEAMKARWQHSRSGQLSDWHRQQIKHYAMVGMPQTAIGHRFGVSDYTIRKIIKGQS